MLRSWEDRFAAAPVMLRPGYLEISVGAPPRPKQQKRAQAELQAVMGDQAPDATSTWWVVGWG